jgi:hypothetical protein
MKLLLPVRWLPLAAALLSPLAAAAVSAATPKADNDKPVLLPELQVNDTALTGPPESWRYARIDGFEVLSNVDDALTRDLLGEFARFRLGAKVIWPAATRPLAASTILLCGEQVNFAQFDPTPGQEGTRPLSLLLRNSEQLAIVVDLNTRMVKVDPKLMGLSTSEAAGVKVDRYRLLYRQYIGLLLSQGKSRPPAWLEEGLTQLILDIEIVDQVLRYGRLDRDKIDGPDADPNDLSSDSATDSPITAPDNSLVVGDEPFYFALRHRDLMPFAQFFAVPHDAPETQSPLGNTLWAKQAYAFVHFCLFGEDQRYREAFGKFMTRAVAGPVDEQVFRECFKVGYKEMEQQLSFYTAHPRHKYQKYTFQPEEMASLVQPVLRGATIDEVGLMKGDALRLAGKTEAAAREYRAAYLNGARTPDLLAAWGGLEAVSGTKERAAKLLAAAKTGGTRPSGPISLARFRLNEMLTAPANKSGLLESVQVSELLGDLFRARSLMPPQPETYELIAEVWSHSASAPKPEHLTVLDEGVRVFPRDTPLVAHAARLYSQIGLNDRARELAQLGLANSPDAASRSDLEAFLHKLPSDKQ